MTTIPENLLDNARHRALHQESQDFEGAPVGSHTHPESDVTSLVTDLSNRVLVAGSIMSQKVQLTGDISPSSIGANQNDYNPTGLSTAAVLRLTSSAAYNITGIQGGSDGRILVIYNIGSFTITLKNADTGSSAANRFAMNGDLAIRAGDGVALVYDSTATRWVAFSQMGGSGLSLTIQEVDASPSGTPSTLQFPNGTLTDHGSGVYEYVPASGGSGTGTLFLPDLPPASPNSNDDEFSTGSLGGSWTEWDPGNKVTVSVGSYGLKLVFAASSGDSLGGVYRAVPSGDWSLTTKVSLASTGVGGNTEAGIFITEDVAANPTTADIETFMVRYDGGSVLTLAAQRWTAYNALSSTQFFTSTRTHGGSIYLRLRRISTTMYFDYSFDGISWLQAGTMAAPFTIADIVLGGVGRSSDASNAYFRFYRQTSTTTVDQPLLGNLSTAASFPVAHGCRLYHSTTQNITSGTGADLLFDSEDDDTDAYHSTSTNKERITIPTGLAGVYMVTAGVAWGGNSGGGRFLEIHKNGASPNGTEVATAGDVNYGPVQRVTNILRLAAGDYLTVAVFQNSGSTLAVGSTSATPYTMNSFSAYLIGT